MFSGATGNLAERDPGAEGGDRPSSSVELLGRALRGDRGALDDLIARLLPSLHRWAHGRLPRWARGALDTADLVQDALLRTVRRLSGFEPRRRQALQAYLRQAIQNRIRDELRRVGRQPVPGALDPDLPEAGPSPLDQAVGAQTAERYKRALARLSAEDRELLVARLELGYSYAQVAVATGRPGAEAARKAVQRALVRLGEELQRG